MVATTATSSSAARPVERAPSLETATRTSGHALKKGMSGESVADLQRLLNKTGAKLTVDGKFGDKTDRAVRHFQQTHGLHVDGMAGTHTLPALKRAAAHANPQVTGRHDATRAPTPDQQRVRHDGGMRGADLQRADERRRAQDAFAPKHGRAAGPLANHQAQRERQAEALLHKNGVHLHEGRTYVVQVDKDPPKNSSYGYLHGYTGKTVVMRAHNSKLHEVGGPFRSASHPGQTTSDGSVPGTAWARGGAYTYTKHEHWYNGKERYDNVPITMQGVARDTNHDGTITGSERHRRYTATAIQWHPGGSSGPSSTGCQNIDPSQWEAFQRAVEKGGGDTFTYVLAHYGHHSME